MKRSLAAQHSSKGFPVEPCSCPLVDCGGLCSMGPNLYMASTVYITIWSIARACALDYGTTANPGPFSQALTIGKRVNPENFGLFLGVLVIKIIVY